MGNSLVNAAREGNLAKVAKVCGDSKTNINYQESEVCSADFILLWHRIATSSLFLPIRTGLRR